MQPSPEHPTAQPHFVPPVVPHVEREADWAAHRAAVLADLMPVGYVETCLVDHLAALLWEQQRTWLQREAALVERQWRAEDAWSSRLAALGSEPAHPDDFPAAIQRTREALTVLETVAALPPDAPLPPPAAVRAVRLVAEVAGLPLHWLRLPELPPDQHWDCECWAADEYAWTAAAFERVVDAIVAEALRLHLAPTIRPWSVLEAAAEAARAWLARAPGERRQQRRQLAQAWASAASPTAEPAAWHQHATRLSRQIADTLGTLQALQARRPSSHSAP